MAHVLDDTEHLPPAREPIRLHPLMGALLQLAPFGRAPVPRLARPTGLRLPLPDLHSPILGRA